MVAYFAVIGDSRASSASLEYGQAKIGRLKLITKSIHFSVFRRPEIALVGSHTKVLKETEGSHSMANDPELHR